MTARKKTYLDTPQRLYGPIAETSKCHLAYTETRDVDEIMKDIRQGDQDEWVAFNGLPMAPTLDWCVRNSFSLTLRLNETNKPLIIFGAQDYPHDILPPAPKSAALGWFVGANEGYNHVPHLAVLANSAFRHLHDEYPHIIAYMDDRNVGHHPWVAHYGFQFEDYLPMGPFGLPFWRIRKSARSHRNEVR